MIFVNFPSAHERGRIPSRFHSLHPNVFAIVALGMLTENKSVISVKHFDLICIVSKKNCSKIIRIYFLSYYFGYIV